MSDLIINTIENFLETMLPSEGLELFEVQFRREGQGWVLRVFVDSDAGVTLDHCGVVSRELSQYLDVEDLIDHAYSLEVSSPGLERPLRKTDDFRRFIGRKARVKFHDSRDGNKIFEGLLMNVEDDLVTMQIDGEQDQRFTLEDINKARLAI